jgi:saccharopine dehydrogenase-like NADP-dependent oxidoreductase
MNNILVIGAGRSSSSLISFLLGHASAGNWLVTVGDISEALAKEKIGNHAHGKAIRFDVQDVHTSRKAIAGTDVVISLLPAHLHPVVARYCLDLKKHLLHASYVSDEMRKFHDEARNNALLFLGECGLDPGIDHMSAMQVIDRIRYQGGKLMSFESFTGGLIAPDTDPLNPWRYKFTWNPRNVVLAGQGTAKFLQQGKYRYIPYQQLFRRITEITVDGYGEFEGYANRDSLKYLETYGLEGVGTMLRGTLRNKGFCSAWNVLVQLGCCDDTYLMEDVEALTHRDYMDAFLDGNAAQTVEEKLCLALGLSADGEEMKRLRWSGLFADERIGLHQGTPAQLLEHILSKRWKLAAGDKDFIVMWHRFVYKKDGLVREIKAQLAVTGTDETNTAMAKTVGLPLAIAAKLLLEGKITSRGVVIPVTREFYEPILQELHGLGIRVEEVER